MGYATVLAKVGEFGLYQKLLCGVFVFYTTYITGLNYYSQVFIFEAPPHRCSMDGLDAIFENYLVNQVNASSRSEGEIPLPWQPTTRVGPSQCTKYNLDLKSAELKKLVQRYFSRLDYVDGEYTVPSEETFAIQDFFKNVSEISCNSGWRYDHSLLFATITSENNWVCEEEWRNVFIQTMFWVGNTVGCLLWGYTNDRFGRKPTVIIVHWVYFIGGIFTMAANNFYILVLCRFFVGCAHHTISHLPYLIVLEYCGVSSRSVPLLMVLVSYSLASMTVPWVASILPSWYYLAGISAASVLPVILCYKLIPESPSWLVIAGREEEAIEQLKTVAKINKQPVEEAVWRQELYNEKEIEATGVDPKESSSLLELVKTPVVRVNALLVTIICMMGFMCYYGNVQNTGNLASTKYMSYFLGAVVEIPCWTVPFAINKLGRRWPLVTLFFLSGVCGVAYGNAPVDMPALALALAFLGRMYVTAAYFICLQYASEIFPTVIRGQGVAMCETFGSIAIFISPSIIYLKRYSIELPLLILGLCSLVGSIATFFLPETNGQILPQTLQEAKTFGEEFGVKHPCKRRKKTYDVKKYMATANTNENRQQDNC